MTVMRWLLLFAAMCSAGCATPQHVPGIDFGGSAMPPGGLELRVAQITREPKVRLVLSNHSNQPFVYQGWSPDSPVFLYDFSIGVARIPSQLVGCGMGIAPRTVLPGETLDIVTSVPVSLRTGRTRIGIPAADDRFVVWSPVIDVVTRTLGATPRR